MAKKASRKLKKGNKKVKKRAKKKKVAKKTVKRKKNTVGRKKAKKKTAKKRVSKTKTKVRKKTAKKSKTKAKTKTMAKTRQPRVVLKPEVIVPPVPPSGAQSSGSNEEKVGYVTHYYSHLGVAVVRLDQGLVLVGDTIHIQGHTSDFKQRIESMEVENQKIYRAVAGQEFGLKVIDHAREHDQVYRVN